MIRSLSTNHKLPSRSARLRAKGLLTAKQIAELIASKHRLVNYWRQKGLLNGIRLNDKNEYLYEHPNEDTIQQIKRRIKLSKPTTYPRYYSTYEAQYETNSFSTALTRAKL